MNETTAHVPEWYDPSTAPTVEPGGHWVPPLAAGIHNCGATISIVVLKHRSFEPAYIREFPDDNCVVDRIHGCLAEAAKKLGDFNLFLCCAIAPWRLNLPQEDTLFGAPGPWLWVRYPHFSTSYACTRNKFLDEAWRKNHYVALAMATQLQEDFNTLHQFNREFRHLQTITQAMSSMKQILLTRMPADMRRIAKIYHDLSF